MDRQKDKYSYRKALLLKMCNMPNISFRLIFQQKMETLKIGYRLVQILSFIIFLSQTWVTIIKFSHKPVVQEVSVERHEELKYNIYLCHLNGFDVDKAMELGYYAPYTYFSGTLKVKYKSLVCETTLNMSMVCFQPLSSPSSLL